MKSDTSTTLTNNDDDYFELNLTRSQLSDIICRNEDCEGVKKFALKGIGPLVPNDQKEPKIYEYPPPPPLKETKNEQVQTPKKFPCGHPKCKYLKVYPDGTPIGCRKETCKYSRRVCDDPTCTYNKYLVKAVCSVCGGYSISGKTCEDIQKDECKENISMPPLTSEQPKRKTGLIAPKSLLPFDQLQAAARKERLQTMEEQFILAVGQLEAIVMSVFEKHFDIFNPHVKAETANRGEVWANNNFYNFYIKTTKYTTERIRELLIDIWNQSVATKEAKINMVKDEIKETTLPNKFVSPTKNVCDDLVEYIVNNFGMKSSQFQFYSYVSDVITKAVLLNKNNIPPDRIPNSPNLSDDEDEIEKEKLAKKKIKKPLSSNVSPTNFHIKLTYGHKYCIPASYSGDRPVPRDMGWLWNLGEQMGKLVPRRYYKPGAVPKAIAKIIKSHKMALHDQHPIVKRKKAEVTHTMEPMLSVQKKEGEYLIRVIPYPNPYWTSEENKQYTPLIFLITKRRDKILKINPDGTRETVLECDCRSDTESSIDEFQIDYAPPVQYVDPIEAKLRMMNPKKGCVERQIQCDSIKDRKDKKIKTK